MKISNKIQQEVNFLCTFFADPKGYKPSDEEIKMYVNSTVYGTHKESVGGISGGQISVLFQAKRNLDIAIKVWRKDMIDGILAFIELEQDYGNHPYGMKLLRSIRKGLDFSKYIPGLGCPEIVALNLLYQHTTCD